MTLPKENLDNKVFSDLLKEAISRIPIYAPEWTDYNIHDPGITFIELFAWLTEMQIYRLNRISDKSYRKFLKLMGIQKLKSANAAKLDVTFSLLSGIIQPDMPVTVPKSTIVAATDLVTGEDILFRTEYDLTIINTELRVLSHQAEAGNIYIENSQANENENVYYFAFGSDKPKKDDELYIGFKDDPGKEIVLAFHLLDDEPLKKEENSVLVPSGILIWEYLANEKWNKVENITDGTTHLSVSGRVRINIPNSIENKDIDNFPTKGLYWLRCRVDVAGYELPPKIDCILLNTVPAVHVIQYENKFSSTGLPDFYIDLKYAPVLDQKVLDKTDENKQKINLSVYPSSSNSYVQWIEVEDFDSSKPENEHYTVDLASGRVTFGNGINGKIPPKDAEIEISYYSGGGTRGNVKPGAITRIISNDRSKDIIGKVTVTNNKAASGGTEAETLEEAIQRARKELKKVTRAVTSADYEYLALNTPGLRVARAKALPRYHPSQDREVPGIISVIVVPKSSLDNPNPMPSQNFVRAVYSHLEKYRLLTTELFVLPPKYVNVLVTATVVVKPKNLPNKVKENVENKLKDFLHPVSGGFDHKGWPFGRSVYISEIYEVIDGVEGVDYVEKASLIGKLESEKGDGVISPTVMGNIEIPAEGLVSLLKTDITAKEETRVFGV